jgi:hypothetical protein
MPVRCPARLCRALLDRVPGTRAAANRKMPSQLTGEVRPDFSIRDHEIGLCKFGLPGLAAGG